MTIRKLFPMIYPGNFLIMLERAEKEQLMKVSLILIWIVFLTI